MKANLIIGVTLMALSSMAQSDRDEIMDVIYQYMDATEHNKVAVIDEIFHDDFSGLAFVPWNPIFARHC